MSSYIAWLCWVPALGVLVGARWLTGRLVGARPALWPRQGAWWKRVAVAVSGSAVCMVGVVLVVFVPNVINGTRGYDGMVLVAEVEVGSPGERAQLRVGDRIAAVDGNAVHEPHMLVARIEQATGPVTLEIHDSDGNIGFSTVTPVGHRIGIDMEQSVSARPGLARAWHQALGMPMELVRAVHIPERPLTWSLDEKERSLHDPWRLRRLDRIAVELFIASVLGQIIALVLLAIPRRRAS